MSFDLFWTVEKKLDLYKMYIAGKKWKEMAPVLGNTAEACKKACKRTNWGKFIMDNDIDVEKLVKGVDSKESDADKVSLSLDKIIDDKKKKIIADNEKRKLNESIEKIAKENLIYEKIVSAISRVPDLSLKEIRKAAKMPSGYHLSPQESILLLSDLHVGLACIPEEVGGIGNYSVEIFKQRMDNLCNSVLKITELHRLQHPLDTINVFGLGDFCHGSRDAGLWGSLHLEQDIINQVFIASTKIRELLLCLKQNYGTVKFYGVVGNHSRVSRKGVEKSFVNWDFLIYKWVEESLKDQSGIEFDIPKAKFQIAEIMDRKILAIHGDQAHSWMSIPFYGLSRLESKYKSIIDGSKNMPEVMNLLNESNIDQDNTEDVVKFVYNYVRNFSYMICGHHHVSSQIETKGGGKLIVNSSFVGGDDYSIGD